jgi:hypothetical protein
MKFSYRHVFNLTVVVFLGIYVWTALSYSYNARLMPLVIGLPLFILAIIQTVIDLRLSRKKADAPMQAETPSGVIETSSVGSFKKEVNALLWAIGLFIGFYLIGFLFATGLFTFLSLKIRSRLGWRASISVSVGCLAFLWIVMIYGLRVDLYEGSIMIALRRAIYGY